LAIHEHRANEVSKIAKSIFGKYVYSKLSTLLSVWADVSVIVVFI
jgi:hypothetical protein